MNPQTTPAVSEFLAFKLGSEEYGIDILRVQEVRSFAEPTRIALSEPYVLGVINLRGLIVPIIDMRLKFNMATVNYDEMTVVIMLNIAQRVIGIVADGVSDVIRIEQEQMRAVPDISSSIGNEHFLAIGSLEDRMLILLDIVKLMQSQEMGLFSEAA
jgi:purine-binding chemotaxis protein CheW